MGGRRTALLLRHKTRTIHPTVLPDRYALAAVGLLGGARRRRSGWGWLIPRVPYPCLIPQGVQTAIPAARPRKGDVRNAYGAGLRLYFTDPGRHRGVACTGCLSGTQELARLRVPELARPYPRLWAIG